MINPFLSPQGINYLRRNCLVMKKIVFCLNTLFFLSCQSTTQKIPVTLPKPITYLALGDSYTIGESVDESMRWPNQLSKKLNQNGFPMQSPLIIARTGWTTDELLTAIESSNLNSTYDYVSLLVGVNNQYRGRSIENFREEFITLLEKSIALSKQEKTGIFVLSIPDWGVTPFAASKNKEQIALEIDAFNAIIRQECAIRSVNFFDITPISRQAEQNPLLLANDGLHPSGLMYTQWVDLVVPFFN